MKSIRIGVLGMGRWGPNVVGSLMRVPQVSISLVADINEYSLVDISTKYPNIKTSIDPSDLLNSSDIDAVAICTPVETHLDLVEQSLFSGKHVFVEKPFGLDPIRCKEISDLAENSGLCLMIGHVFLFNSSIIALKKIINNKDFGEIFHIEAERTNLGPVRKDVNAVWDLTSHDLSIFNFLFDAIPEAVSCIGKGNLDPKIEDTSFTTFRYPKGILAHARASWLNPRKVRQITVVGSKKMVVWDDLNLEHPISIYDSSIGLNQSYYSDSFSSHRLSYHHGDVTLPSVPTNEPLHQELCHFVKVIQGNAETISDGKFATDIVRALKTADKSLSSGGTFLNV